MRVSIVLNRANRSWIIEKIAHRLREELISFGLNATVSEEIDSECDIVHHMSWAFANKNVHQPSTMFITHIDDHHKLSQVRSMLSSKLVSVGICMSSDTREQLIDAGVDGRLLTVVLPAHDGRLQPRRIILGFTTKLYPDGRKREQLLLELARRMQLDCFEFRIFGSGWESVVPELERAGALVVWHREGDDYQSDYDAMLTAIPNFDYYVYLGLDEGSLGTLDALAAGVKTIVTPQGFHLDLPSGITHPVLTVEDLEAVLRSIAEERQARFLSVQALTWKTYAMRHAEVWGAVLNQSPLPKSGTLHSQVADQIQAQMQQLRRENMDKNAFSFRRVISHISHFKVLRPVRSFVDRMRLRR